MDKSILKKQVRTPTGFRRQVVHLPLTNMWLINGWGEGMKLSKKETKAFYDSSEWRKLRKEVLKDYKHECQECKKRGRYTKATHVHHMKHLDKYPELGLERAYTENGMEKVNLLPLCADCHTRVYHPEHLKRNRRRSKITERWD